MEAVVQAFILLVDAVRLVTKVAQHVMGLLMEIALFVILAFSILRDIVLRSVSILL
jgi:hypothetical protein